MSSISSPQTNKRHSARQLRERKHKKLYSEDWALGDEEVEERRSFSVQDKLVDPAFASTTVIKEMQGSELTVGYLQKHGFNTPLLFREKTGLGLRVPTTNFTVNDVRMCVGSRRILDVMDVNTQKNSEMTMKEWQRYYDDPNKDRLLNVISLEFSHTKLENYVQTPSIVRQVDWVDCVWPRHLKDSQIEATNLIEDMKYPKVQKYCLMSVKGCYTDFHIDFGGTSVWYHILKGGKVFWLIPPTERNLDLFEKWVLSGKQSDIFFGDTVDKCVRIELKAGNTFFIPTGWIHAVYTPEDSLIFGGNFLHSFGIEKQLKVAQVEDATKVPQKFRYPFFTEMLWYVLERYVHSLLGRSHLSSGTDTTMPPDRPHQHLTQFELHGLKEIVLYLHMLPASRKNVPDLIKDPVALIQDVRTLIGLHRQDQSDLAVTGKPILQVPEGDQENRHKYQRTYNKTPPTFKGPKGISGKGKSPGDKGGGPRRRRTRCKKCEACQRSDCGECTFCLDMVKFGGPGRAKQTCNMRQCLQPMLPVTAACIHCGLDGWGQTPVIPLQKGPQRCESASTLMECSVCYEIAHPACVQRICAQYSGYINEDLPNSWECPLCCKLGKNTDYRPRHFRARQKSSDMRRMSISSDASTVHDIKPEKDGNYSDENHSDREDNHKVEVKPEIIKQEVIHKPSSENSKPVVPIKKRRLSDDESKQHNVTNVSSPNNNKQAMRSALASQIIANTSKPLKKPMYVVRPAPALPTAPAASPNLFLDKRALLPIFRLLSPKDLVTCSLVCKSWSKLAIDPQLWKTMDFSHKHISSDHLKAIVRRQPEKLMLDWSIINKYQLPWLVQRTPGLHDLSLVSVNLTSVVALRTCYCAQLQVLDLSYVTGFNDSSLRDILAPNNDSRQVFTDEKIRLRNLHTLRLAGTDITDIAMRYVTQYLPNLRHLSLNSCARISDAGIAQLSTRPAATVTNLISLDLSHSKLVTEVSLEHLSKCENLIRLDLRHASLVSTQAVIKFAAKSDNDLQVRDVKLVDRRQAKAKT